MSTDAVEQVAEAVLYEGYLLYPYRPSALKNQQRWTFGGVYPRGYSEASGGDDPWCMQTQCLLLGDADTALAVKVRFLQVADMHMATAKPDLEARGGQVVELAGEEAIEREFAIDASDGAPLRLGDLLRRPLVREIAVAAGSAEEPRGEREGSLVRRWQALQGAVEVEAAARATAPAEGGRSQSCYRLTVRISNGAPWTAAAERPAQQRTRALRQAFISTHTILRLRGGEFLSLLEPPPSYQAAAEACRNIKTWPVLAGTPGERHTLLSSPIILYDYPQVSPESPGNFFDATEIDELLTLSVMALTDEEKQELRASDARGREILERAEALSGEQIMKLHGAVRRLGPARREGP